MLPDRLYRMLTAYVDGELDDGQRKTVLRLLRRSATARNLLRRLQGDADCLRQLARPVLARDVSAQVVQSLDGGAVEPSQRTSFIGRPGLRAWRAMAIAATVLLVIGLGAYLHLAAKHQAELSEYDGRLQHLLAQVRSGSERPPDPAFEDEPRVADLVPGPNHANAAPAAPPDESRPLPEKGVANAVPPATSSSGAPNKTEENRLGAPLPSVPKLKTADVDIAFIRPLRALDQDKVRHELTEELRKGKARRMDLGCFDVASGMNRLQAAFAKQGIGWLIDHDAENVLKLGLKWDYAVYIDSLNPEDMATILRELRSDDRETESKRRGPVQFGELVLNALSTEDHRNLIKLLGADPTTVNRSNGSLKGQGGSPPRETDRLALVVPYDPGYSRSNSPEVMHFLRTRKERPAGTIPMLLIVHRGKSQ